MSIQLLVECSDEVRRLAVAGSSLAVGDYRLKRLIKPLEQAGQKAAIFARIAKAVEAVGSIPAKIADDKASQELTGELMKPVEMVNTPDRFTVIGLRRTGLTGTKLQRWAH